MKLFFLLPLFFLSCTSEIEMKKDHSGRYLIDSKDLEVKMVKALPWGGGATKAFDISAGFQVVIAMPNVGEQNLRKIAEEKKVDSWLVQITRSNSGSKEVIGAFSLPLFNQQSSFKSSGSGGRSLIIEVIYTASYMSSSNNPEQCPMLGHNKKIDTLEIVNEPQGSSRFSVASFDPQKYNGLIEPKKLSANKINGSKSLLGDYTFEIAFFQSSTKIVVSNFLTYPQKVSLKSEKSYLIKDCVHGSPNDSKPGMKDFIKDFKFGH